jgi:ABC-type multidrug transport system fused ATPase/permease subunit
VITKLLSTNEGKLIIFGEEINNIDEVRKNFSVVSQDPFVYEGTI